MERRRRRRHRRRALASGKLSSYASEAPCVNNSLDWSFSALQYPLLFRSFYSRALLYSRGWVLFLFLFDMIVLYSWLFSLKTDSVHFKSKASCSLVYICRRCEIFEKHELRKLQIGPSQIAFEGNRQRDAHARQ